MCLALGLLLMTVSNAAELTEETAKQVISRVDNAVNELNSKAVGDALSDNVSITININMKGQKQVMKPSKQEYISMLEQGWAQYTNYKYNRSNAVVKIIGNKAFVTGDVSESMTVHGQNISGTSKEETTIELVNGQLLITEVIGYISM